LCLKSAALFAVLRFAIGMSVQRVYFLCKNSCRRYLGKPMLFRGVGSVGQLRKIGKDRMVLL